MAQAKERRSISGIRGTAETLTYEKAAAYTKAFATLLREVKSGNRVVVGRDTRPKAAQYEACVIDSLCDAGWDVIDLGVVPTPTAQLAITKFDAAGGVVVTASHNPVEYYGVKFLQNREGHGMFLDKEQVNRVFSIFDAGKFGRRRAGERYPVSAFAEDFDDPPYTTEFLDRNRIELHVDNAIILDFHLHRLISAMGRDLDRIRGMNVRVAMDCCGGAGVPVDYVLLDYLYCDTKRVNEQPGEFPRTIEPTPRNLVGLCEALRADERDYDAGFATDCDNDRCVLIARDPETCQYKPLEEDYTFAIAVDQVLDTSPEGSTVVSNWSTSQMLDDVAQAHHANLRRAPTGEVHTTSEAIHYHAAIAGEGSCAGVIDPRVGPGRDVLVVIWHILAALASSGKSLYAIASELPRYYKVNRDHASTRSVEETKAILEQLQVYYAGKGDIRYINREDGLIVLFKNRSRIQIRGSNTEPLLRVRSEATSEREAQDLVSEAQDLIGRYSSA